MKDPVCGMEVNQGTPYKANYKDNIYWFCSIHCQTQFEINPKKFVKDQE